MSKEDWVWMPHPGHFICAYDCRFVLNTMVGHVIVSTVGELWPSDSVREIFAKMRGVELEGQGDERRASYLEKIGFEDIGYQRKYETMVFAAVKAEGDDRGCCPYAMSGPELDMRGYNDAAAAYKGHLELCEEWDGKVPEKREEEI